MKSVIFRYGIFAGLTIVVLGVISFFFLQPPKVSWAAAEVAGYLTMILAMVFVFAGIRHYRDHVNNGALSFGQGMKIGILIVLIPSVAFGLFDILFTEVIDPTWVETYYRDYIARAKASTPPDEWEAKLKQLENEKEMFSNPVFQFVVMGGTVLIIGLIATIISSLTLMRKKKTAIA